MALFFFLSTALLPLDALADAAADPGMSEARALFLAGRVAFDEGRFETAIKYFEASYEQSKRPQLLYNIAQCYDRLRRDEAAIAAFERYLSAEPQAENRELVEGRIRALRAAVEERARQNAAAPAASTPRQATSPASAGAEATPAPSTSRTWALAPAVTLGAGALVALSGGVLMIVGKGVAEDVEKAKLGVEYASLRADKQRAEREWLAGQILLGVGGAAAAAGLVWLLVARPREQNSVQLSITPSTLGIAGAF